MEKIPYIPYSAKIEFKLSIGFSQACQSETVKISDYWDSKDEWDSLTAVDQREELQSWQDGWADNYIDVGWSVV